jgi:hypothetical protein
MVAEPRFVIREKSLHTDASYVIKITLHRGVAQSGSAPALGAGGRRFESSHPDQLCACSSAG